MELVGGTERKRFGRARGAGARLARLVISRFFFHSGTEYSAMQAAGSLVEYASGFLRSRNFTRIQ